LTIIPDYYECYFLIVILNILVIILCVKQWVIRLMPRILKAHSHSMSGGSIWASFDCQYCFWIVGGLVSYLNMWLLILQLFKNSIDTQEKLRLNFHSLSVSELSEYRRRCERERPRYLRNIVLVIVFCISVPIRCWLSVRTWLWLD
jgi:hypothetical protein